MLSLGDVEIALVFFEVKAVQNRDVTLLKRVQLLRVQVEDFEVFFGWAEFRKIA